MRDWVKFQALQRNHILRVG